MPTVKALVVEGHKPFAQFICLSLQQRPGFDITLSSDGLEAVSKAQELQPDLVLLDTALPKLSGLEVANRIRNLVPAAKLLFISQESSVDVVRETMRLGARGYIHKHYAMSDLNPAIDAVIAGKRFIGRRLEFRAHEDPRSAAKAVAHRKRDVDFNESEKVRLAYAAIVESSDDAIIFKSLDGVVSAWNPAAQRMFGHTPKEMIGQSITIIVPPELRHEEEMILRRLAAGQRIDHYETRRVSKNGTLIDVSISVSPVRDADGRILGASTIVRDITGRKRAESALRESDERFRMAMNNVAAGVYTLDLEGVVTYVNPAAEAMFGWTNAELVGRKMHDVTHYMHPDGTPFPASECPGLRIASQGHEIREHEDTLIRKDGSLFPVVLSASPLQRDGQPVGIVVGFRDDTLRREAERSLRESEERFRLVANAAPVMIWMSGVDKLCNYFNQVWLEFTGRPLEAELGDGWTEGVHSEDLSGCLETYTKAFERREAFRMEYRLRRADGEYRWIFDHGVPRFNTDGSFAGYIGTCIDVTERKLAEEAISRVGQRLIEAQDEERRRIARELHDDISQRLSLLALTLEGCLHSSGEDVQNSIKRAVQHVSNVGAGVRALSHRLHSANLEYLGLAAAVIDYCDELSREHKVEINRCSENVPERVSREVSLCIFRVAQEALQNALKHSGSRNFQVSLKGGGDEIELRVQDSGKGFEEEKAISGLGLTSMRERLKLVSGKLSIQSQLGHGTTVHARVPLKLA